MEASEMTATPHRGRPKNTPKTSESVFMHKANQGAVYYSEKEPKYWTALAGYYGKKIRTEKVLIISDLVGFAPESKMIFKITIL